MPHVSMLMPGRRFVLKSALGGVAALALPPFAGRAFAASPSITPLADGLALITGAGANVLALSAADGAVLVDSGAPDATDALMAAVEQTTGGRKVTTIFNTHRHLENTGGNAAFRKAGVDIVAHQYAAKWMAHPFWEPQEYRYEPAREKAALPTRTFLTEGELTVENERIAYGHMLEAHTEGDIYIHFRNLDVLAVGDVASPVRDIRFDWYTGAWTGARLDAMEKIIGMAGPDTRIVPSFGPVMTREEVQAEHGMLLAIHDEMVELLRKGYGAQDMLEAGVMENTGRQWQDPFQFLYAANKGLWAHQTALKPDIV